MNRRFARCLAVVLLSVGSAGLSECGGRAVQNANDEDAGLGSGGSSSAGSIDETGGAYGGAAGNVATPGYGGMGAGGAGGTAGLSGADGGSSGTPNNIGGSAGSPSCAMGIDVNCTSALVKTGAACVCDCVIGCGFQARGTKHCVCQGG